MPKVKFNIKNAHYAIMTRGTGGAISYGAPVAVPGSRKLSLDLDGDLEIFYADGVKYWIDNTKKGYNGDWELAYIADALRKAILQEIQDSKGVLFELENPGDPVEFAFGFQIDGNDYDTRFWFYDCVASEAKVEAETNEGKRTPQTDTLHLTISGAAVKSGDDRNFLRAKCLSNASGNTYDEWFDAVVIPGTFSTT